MVKKVKLSHTHIHTLIKLETIYILHLRDTACILSSLDPSLLLRKWVGLARLILHLQAVQLMNVAKYVLHFVERLGLFFREMWFTDCSHMIVCNLREDLSLRWSEKFQPTLFIIHSASLLVHYVFCCRKTVRN